MAITHHCNQLLAITYHYNQLLAITNHYNKLLAITNHYNKLMAITKFEMSAGDTVITNKHPYNRSTFHNFLCDINQQLKYTITYVVLTFAKNLLSPIK